MTVQDFTHVMEKNRDMYPEFHLMSFKEKFAIANDHIERGVAESYLGKHGEVIGVGGIDFVGVGEGWFISLPEQRTSSLLRTVKEQFNRIRKAKNLVKIYATSRISENFLKHLGFKKHNSVHIYSESGPNGHER
jgi:hypothetical protein